MKRTYIGELEWVLQQINLANGDSNPNRAAQVEAAVKYGLEVCIAKRSKEVIPPRPNLKKII